MDSSNDFTFKWDWGVSPSYFVEQSLKSSITTTLGVQAVLGIGKYLGLPFMVSRSKKATFRRY
uniref:Transmembrane protein n=1 Tax=Medicago truncatula TaxID=3880 RepID=A2Q264_MEDTR|nr:hypothetical protein MtrDRAFT_AC149210g17v2 [Medicago truncatula]